MKEQVAAELLVLVVMANLGLEEAVIPGLEALAAMHSEEAYLHLASSSYLVPHCAPRTMWEVVSP